MKKLLLVALLIIFVCLVFWIIFLIPKSNKTVSLKSTNTGNALDHIVVIMMENKPYDEIVGSSSAPYINSLIQKYSFADNYFAVGHPSLPNYLALIGGSTFGITSDCDDCYIASTNLTDQLEGSHKTWKAYMESMPSPCFTGNAGEYVQKHNPFIYFNDIRNSVRCNNIVPFTEIKTDLVSENTLPNFVWISPNLCNDMHDCSVHTGDTWLSEEVPSLLSSPAFTKQKSLLVITWDEGEGDGDNKVPTLFIGNSLANGFVSHTKYSHYSLLHTIEKVWKLPTLTNAVSESPLIDVIKP